MTSAKSTPSLPKCPARLMGLSASSPRHHKVGQPARGSKGEGVDMQCGMAPDGKSRLSIEPSRQFVIVSTMGLIVVCLHVGPLSRGIGGGEHASSPSVQLFVNFSASVRRLREGERKVLPLRLPRSFHEGRISNFPVWLADRLSKSSMMSTESSCQHHHREGSCFLAERERREVRRLLIGLPPRQTAKISVGIREDLANPPLKQRKL